jgi:phosphoglucosamine mutase
MEKLFGTDGIRGVANEWPLTPEFITRIGEAIGQVLGQGEHVQALIGRDTRQSGAMIENALAAGMMAQGLDTMHVGVLTTPGVAYLTRRLGTCCGVSISASHNPFEDNGIKVFGADGFKVPDASESEIETLAQSREGPKTSRTIGERRDSLEPIDAYVDFLLAAVKRQDILSGKRVVVDCNNGATFALSRRVMSALGAHVIALNDTPDGTNINRGYDSLEPRLLRETVLREHADWGVQFDGDGDRAVLVDECGGYVDGDYILAILARDFAASGELKTRSVVSTVMANVGLERSLGEFGVTLERTAVGDRWVTERMRATSAQIGGEQSGHVILFDGGHTTGDGLYTALRVAQVLAKRGEPLSALAACMTKYPQVLINVRVSRKPPLEQLPQLQTQIALSQSALGDRARILLRYSGTENLARVMIEGSDSTLIEREANAIARVIRQTIQ